MGGSLVGLSCRGVRLYRSIFVVLGYIRNGCNDYRFCQGVSIV
jgi:hypothetical protein